MGRVTEWALKTGRYTANTNTVVLGEHMDSGVGLRWEGWGTLLTMKVGVRVDTVMPCD